MIHTDDPSANAVLSFALGYLGVEDIVVVGHYGCGGVSAALSMAKERYQPSSHAATTASSPATSMNDAPEHPPVRLYGEEESTLAHWLAPLRAHAVSMLYSHTHGHPVGAPHSHSHSHAHTDGGAGSETELVRELTRAHCCAQVSKLESNPIVQRALKAGKRVAVHGW
jgi:carbonic anhydrase